MLLQWKERLVGLCEVSTTEPLGHTYYWGHDLDGEPDTLWGLEGYTHAVGFFLGHTSTDVFKHEMSLVDKDNLLKTAQGIGSPDYDLHHYDLAGGWLTREDDAGKDSKDSAVAVIHFWASEKDRSKILDHLIRFSRSQKQNPYTKASLQSCGVLKEIRDLGLATLWLRYVHPTLSLLIPSAFSSPQEQIKQYH